MFMENFKLLLLNTFHIYYGVFSFAVLLTRSAHSTHILGLRAIEDRSDDLDQFNFYDVLERVSRGRENSQQHIRRNGDPLRAAKIDAIYNALKSVVNVNDLKKSLREDKETQKEPIVFVSKEELGKLVEKELQNALAKQSSALFDKPYIQQTGKNDFLVMRPDIVDPFVTVIPNDIYYYNEKKCVNWLEDCNAQGIRGRLLQKVMS